MYQEEEDRTLLLQQERLAVAQTCSCSSPSHSPSQGSLAVAFQAVTLETPIPSLKDNSGKVGHAASTQKQAYGRRLK